MASSRSPRSTPAATRSEGYLRRSTDRQEQSIPDQRRASGVRLSTDTHERHPGRSTGFAIRRGLAASSLAETCCTDAPFHGGPGGGPPKVAAARAGSRGCAEGTVPFGYVDVEVDLPDSGPIDGGRVIEYDGGLEWLDEEE